MMDSHNSNHSSSPVAVLLVENDASQAKTIQEFFSDQAAVKIELLHADRLAKALSSLSDKQFHLILLDLNLPDGQGPIVFREIHAKAPNTPIIILGDFEMSVYGSDLILMGAREYLIKGQMTGEQLIAAVQASLQDQGDEIRAPAGSMQQRRDA